MEEKFISIEFTVNEALLLQVAMSMVLAYEQAKAEGKNSDLGLTGAILDVLTSKTSAKSVADKIHSALCLESLKSNLHI